MASIRKIAVSSGIYWVEVPAADLRILCGCPADTVKHLMRKGLIVPQESSGALSETGPNAILLSDLMLQNGSLCSQAEFPVLQMLYRQGLLIPGHPNNSGVRPVLVGSKAQVDAQMGYIFRGNYGLVTPAELEAAGLSPELAREYMRIKLGFAFGKILPSEDLLEAVYLEGSDVVLRGGGRVRRLRTNVFLITHQGEAVEVDLNLAPGQIFEAPFTLGNHLLERDYFAVIHTGDGDGWDMNRPEMGSIVAYQGRIFVVDAGPGIQQSLTALGIGVNEIDGIFHSHGHDDHFAGLTSLIRGDRRIPYYAVPMVRASVVKKLAAALQIGESQFERLFDVRDLHLGQWNDIEGLEVKPVFSPHPVETTIFQFRVKWEGGYRSYAHLADIASSRIMRGMVAPDTAAQGMSDALYKATVAAYREPADVKKIDIGGGLIHGEAADFARDLSGKLIFAHTARRLTEDERALGSGAPFATVDVLIRGVSDIFRRRASEFLRDYFPDVPTHRIRHLMNCDLVVFNPEVLLLKAGDAVDAVYLILSGTVEMLGTAARGGSQLSAGSLIGESPALMELGSEFTYRAVGFVRALKVPVDIYRDFVTRSTLYRRIVQGNERREALRRSTLFSEGVSDVTLNRLVAKARRAGYAKGRSLAPPVNKVVVIQSGGALLRSASGHEERLEAGNHFGALALSAVDRSGARIRFTEDTRGYAVPLESIDGLPVVRWKLLESHRRRYSGY